MIAARVAIAMLAVTGCSQPTPVTPEPASRPRPDPQRLARGRYVAALAGCTVCHGKTLAGGIAAPNLTPDRETGIGAWSDAQIITAVRRGIRPDGDRLAPVMPYRFFHRMTDSDARALVTYLRSIAPVRNAVPRRKPASPPIDLPQPVDNVDPVGRPLEHGRYLANLMHCAGCHSEDFAGGLQMPTTATDSVTSPNITPDTETGIGKWSIHDVIGAITMGQSPHGEIRDPMRAYIAGWSRIDDEDAVALAAYIASVPAIRHQVPDYDVPH